MTTRDSTAVKPALFLIDKPVGPTSHDIVRQVRRWTGVRRVGHGGTLDPLATGLLPVFVGNATRLIEYLSEHPKSYTATFRLGVSTDTDDAEGTVIAELPVPPLSSDAIDAALDAFRGDVQQVPPDFSAVKIDGVSAHRAARRGEPLEIAARTVTFHAIGVVAWDAPNLRVEMTVGSGTYVRSLARDLGAALGCGAHVTEMRRTRIGPVSVDDAHTPDVLEAAFVDGRGEELADSPARFLSHWSQMRLSDVQQRQVLNGQSILMSARGPGAAHVLALGPTGDPFAVLVPEGSWPERWRPVKVLGRRA